MYRRTYNSDYRYKLHKLSVGKCNLKLRLQQISKRNNSKIKNMPNYLSINNENRNSSKTNTLNYNNSVINNSKMVLKDHSKEGKNSRAVIPKTKVLSITSNSKEIINFNNFYTNENINNKTISSINNEMNTSINENINNSFVHVTLNSNNPYYNQKKINITEVKDRSKDKEKERDKEKKDRKLYESEISRKPISADIKYNIKVNKIISNNNNKNIINHKISIKEKLNIIDENKNRVIKTNRRESSVRLRQDNSSFSKKSNLREKNKSNNTKKNNYSPLLESNKSKNASKVSCPIYNNTHVYNITHQDQNKQKTKNILSNINTISYNNNSNNYIHNFRTNNSNKTNHINTFPNEEEFFNYSNNKIQELSKDEKLIFGDRIMKGYTKQKLLGKGGCGIVWLCTKLNSQIFDDGGNIKKEYAVKQTSKKNGSALMNLADENVQTAKNEIKILCKLNNENNNKFIPRIYDYYEDSNDVWFSFDKGGISISGLSFKIKGDFEKGERIYFIQKGKFLLSLFSTISQFKYLFRSLLSGIDYINKRGIIHSDIKPENILIEYEGDSSENNFKITSIKIIDYGSAFYVNNTAAISSNTPEYLCPEITTGNKKFIKELKNSNLKYANCIDIWSLGITILELCLCCPIWMSFKAKIIINEKTYFSSGLFGCRGRDKNKIYQKQVELSKNFNKKLKNSMLYLFTQNDRDNFIDLLRKILELDYKKRITCQDAINHPFFTD